MSVSNKSPKQTDDFRSKIISAQEALKQNLVLPSEKVLEVSLSFDKSQETPLKISSTRVLNNYVAKGSQDTKSYILLALNDKGKLLTAKKFKIPNLFHTDAEGIKPYQYVNQTEFVVNMKYHPATTKLKLIDTNRKVLLSQKLENKVFLDNKPNYFVLEDTEYRSTTQNPFIKKVKANTNEKNIYITLIGNGYDNSDEFYTAAQQIIDNFYTREPFSNYTSSIKFNFVEANNPPLCTIDAPPGKFLRLCRGGVNPRKYQLDRFINELAVPHDKVVIINNDDDDYGEALGVGTNLAMINGQHPYPAEVFIHEVGHLFGLEDEYIADNRMVGTPTNTTNCYEGDPNTPNKPWPWDEVDPSEMFLGCFYPDKYRSSEDSIMRGRETGYEGNKSFNGVSKKIIVSSILKYLNSGSPYHITNPVSKVQNTDPTFLEIEGEQIPFYKLGSIEEEYLDQNEQPESIREERNFEEFYPQTEDNTEEYIEPSLLE